MQLALSKDLFDHLNPTLKASWEEYLKRENVTKDYIPEIKKYEKEVLANR